jgi:2'-5' RNA ligase
METPGWGFFALVSYVPEPLGSFLDQLRQSLPGVDFPQAHITILPPRPLTVPVEEASRNVRKILSGFPAFTVELTTVKRFQETRVLFLDIGEGNTTVHNLHDALNAGNLMDDEQFEFRPHLTVGGPIDQAAIDTFQRQAEAAWQNLNLPKQFLLDEIVALWARPNGEGTEWWRLWTYSLRSQQYRTASASPTGQTS